MSELLTSRWNETKEALLEGLQGGSQLLVAPVIPTKVEVGWEQFTCRP